MEELREKIDSCDKIIVTALVERFKAVKKIGEYKKQNNLPIIDKEREKKVYEKIERLSNGEINFDILKKIYSVIIQSAVELEKE